MARVDVPVLKTSRLVAFGTTTSIAGDAVNGMRMVNDGATILTVDNLAVGDQTVSTIIVESIDSQVPGPVVITIPANTYTAVLGPFPINLYGSVLEFDVSASIVTFNAFTLL